MKRRIIPFEDDSPPSDGFSIHVDSPQAPRLVLFVSKPMLARQVGDRQDDDYCGHDVFSFPGD